MITGPVWGGNLEILHWNLAAGRWIRPPGDYAGCVLLLETSEELPPAEEVFRMLRNFGERGLLAQFPAILVGHGQGRRDRPSRVAGPAYPVPGAPAGGDPPRAQCVQPHDHAVFNLDVGHTDPQWVLPYGGAITVDGPARRITARY